jgi:uncharacterized membrane protein YcaP (DUF421 family)
MKGQLTLTETSVMITLGAIVSVPMQIPDRGITIGFVALLCILIFQRSLNWIIARDSKVEDVTQGTMTVLVKDGVIDIDAMFRTGMSKQDLFSALREKDYHNLAKAKRVYYEACGMLNIYEEKEKRAGLAVYPTNEPELLENSEKDRDHIACENCGFVTEKEREDEKCEHCGKKQWMEAIY